MALATSLHIYSFQTKILVFSTAENEKTEFCGNALKLDLIE